MPKSVWPALEEVIEEVDEGLVDDILAMACVGGGSISGNDERGLPGGHTSVIGALGRGEGGGGDGGPREEWEEEERGGDCAPGVQEGRCGGAVGSVCKEGFGYEHEGEVGSH